VGGGANSEIRVMPIVVRERQKASTKGDYRTGPGRTGQGGGRGGGKSSDRQSRRDKNVRIWHSQKVKKAGICARGYANLRTRARPNRVRSRCRGKDRRYGLHDLGKKGAYRWGCKSRKLQNGHSYQRKSYCKKSLDSVTTTGRIEYRRQEEGSDRVRKMSLLSSRGKKQLRLKSPYIRPERHCDESWGDGGTRCGGR